MKALILAAGKGERLNLFTGRLPKPLLRVANHPILGHVIDRSVDCGLDEIVVVVGGRRQRLLEGFLEEVSSASGISVVSVTQENPRGTGDAVLAARDAVADEHFLLVYGDLFFDDTVLPRLITMARKGQTAGAMTVSAMKDVSQYGSVNISDGKVVSIAEKEGTGPGFANCGIYVLPLEIFDELERLEKSPRDEYEITSALNSLTQKRTLACLRIGRNRWMDVGRPWDLLQANLRALGSVGQKARPSLSGSIRPVILGEDVVVGDGSTIGPYTVLEDQVVVEAGCRIARSIVMKGAHIGRECSILRSVVGRGARVGRGTRTRVVPTSPIRATSGGRTFDLGMRRIGAFVGGDVRIEPHTTLQPCQLVG
ncbi:MAG: sugar phosphate nucleotidyltransferase [Candidatus Geothermarchaeales archaeon]